MRNLTHVRIEGKLYPLRKGDRWLAQDGDTGEWFSYTGEPKQNTDGFSGEYWYTETFSSWYICTTKPPKDWTKELYELF